MPPIAAHKAMSKKKENKVFIGWGLSEEALVLLGPAYPNLGCRDRESTQWRLRCSLERISENFVVQTSQPVLH